MKLILKICLRTEWCLGAIDLRKKKKNNKVFVDKDSIVLQYFTYLVWCIWVLYNKGGMRMKWFIAHANGNKIFKKLVLMVLPMVLMIMMITPSNDALAANQSIRKWTIYMLI